LIVAQTCDRKLIAAEDTICSNSSKTRAADWRVYAMPDNGSQSVGKEINAWVQTIGIVLAAAWGVYTFIYTQILAPKAAPVNITVDLSLKKISPSDTKEGIRRHLVPVEMRISAKNPSTREVYLLSSSWIAWGVKVHDNGDQPLDDFLNPSPIIPANVADFVARHAAVSAVEVVAFGGLLSDNSLKPNEISSRTLIFYVHPNEYDSLQVQAYIPTVSSAGLVDLEWKLQDNGLVPTMYRLDPAHKRHEIMNPDSDGAYSDPRLGLQQATSMAELSLWQ
jgi:hypothetical protein